MTIYKRDVERAAKGGSILGISSRIAEKICKTIGVPKDRFKSEKGQQTYRVRAAICKYAPKGKVTAKNPDGYITHDTVQGYFEALEKNPAAWPIPDTILVNIQLKGGDLFVEHPSFTKGERKRVKAATAKVIGNKKIDKKRAALEITVPDSDVDNGIDADSAADAILAMAADAGLSASDVFKLLKKTS